MTTNPVSHTLTRAIKWVLFALWFAGWHLWHTWAVWQDPLRRVPGPIGDNTVMLWNLGWVKHALDHHQPGFWFTNAYYPEGFIFLFGTHTWLDGILRWFASPLLPTGFEGSILWANITMLLATVFSGLFTISALTAWGVRLWPMLLMGSSALVFAWFRMFALTGHYHFYGTQWMLGCLALISWSLYYLKEDRPDKSRKLNTAAGLMLGVTFLNDQTMAVFAGVLGGLVCLALAQSCRGRHRLLPLLRFYGWALLPASIHLVPIAVTLADGRFHYIVDNFSPRLVDASSFLLPPDRHLLGSALQGFRKANGLAWAEGSYLGITSMLLLAATLVAAVRYLLGTRKGNAPPELKVCLYAGAAALGFLLLALGDTFIIGRESYTALPERLLKHVPVLNAIRLPQRWVWPAQICLVLGGTLGLQYWITRLSPSKWPQWVVLAIAFLPPLEGQSYPPVPPADFRNDPFLQPPGIIEKVKSEYQSGSVLLMPTAIAYAHSNIFQFLWGYDIPSAVSYTARMPFNVQNLPWKGNQWTNEAGHWLKEKRVQIIVFPYPERFPHEFDEWIKHAKEAVPGLTVVKPQKALEHKNTPE